MRAKLCQTLTCLLFIGLLLQVGCTTVAKQALHEVRGAQAKVHPVSNPADGALRPYQVVRFEPATSTVGPRLCPPELLRAYDRYARALEAELYGELAGGAAALTVGSEILFFQEKGLLGSAMCLTRVRIRSSDELVCEAMVLAESRSFRAGDEDDLAKASVKAIGKFLKKHQQLEDDQGRDERERM